MSTTLFVVRHGQAQALDSRGDAARALTPLGRAELEASCAGLQRHGVTAQIIWTSPLIRSRETAEILSSTLGATVEVAAGLAAGSSPEAMLEALGGVQSGAYAMVGHMPDLVHFIRKLVMFRTPAVDHVEPGGMARVDFEAAFTFGRGRLRWHYGPVELAGL